MSGYVPPPHGSAAEEELEELGDDVIISQETEAHAPKPRASVREEKQSVVISDHPPPSGVASRRRSGRGEATVVIRDRRRLEEMRQAILQRRPRPPVVEHRVWLWAGAALAAFVLGGVVALVAARGESGGGPGPSSDSVPARMGRTESVEPSRAAPQGAGVEQVETKPAAVNLEDLPVERPRKK